MTNPEISDKAAAVAEQGALVAPEKAPSKKGANKGKGAPKANKRTKATAPKKAAKGPRAGALKSATEARTNKRAEVIALMKRAKGVTLAEIMETARSALAVFSSQKGFHNNDAGRT